MIGVAANAVFVHRTMQIVTRLRRQRTERNFSQSLTAGLVRPGRLRHTMSAAIWIPVREKHSGTANVIAVEIHMDDAAD